MKIRISLEEKDVLVFTTEAETHEQAQKIILLLSRNFKSRHGYRLQVCSFDTSVYLYGSANDYLRKHLPGPHYSIDE